MERFTVTRGLGTRFHAVRLTAPLSVPGLGIFPIGWVLVLVNGVIDHAFRSLDEMARVGGFEVAPNPEPDPSPE